jgi:hypothetical protein
MQENKSAEKMSSFGAKWQKLETEEIRYLCSSP